MNITIVTIITIGLRGANAEDNNTKIRNAVARVAIFPILLTVTPSVLIIF